MIDKYKRVGVFPSYLESVSVDLRCLDLNHLEGNLREYRSLQRSRMTALFQTQLPFSAVTSWTSSDVARKFRDLVQCGGKRELTHCPLLLKGQRGSAYSMVPGSRGRQPWLGEIIPSFGEPTSLERCNCFQRDFLLFAMMMEFDQKGEHGACDLRAIGSVMATLRCTFRKE
jgi:hypothetical protein